MSGGKRIPFIETVTTSAGGYVVRWTPAGDRIGEIRHIGWRSWSAKCDTGCPPLLGATRVAAARKLQRHVESHA